MKVLSVPALKNRRLRSQNAAAADVSGLNGMVWDSAAAVMEPGDADQTCQAGGRGAGAQQLPGALHHLLGMAHVHPTRCCLMRRRRRSQPAVYFILVLRIWGVEYQFLSLMSEPLIHKLMFNYVSAQKVTEKEVSASVGAL